MLQSPLVSVIVIFFNAKKEDFFEAAIASILAQTYTHWELLLVDDGSTDGSSEIAQRYAQQYPEKIRYLEHEHHQNHGMSATRNLGLRHVKGDYIAFLDADDLFFPDTLAFQVDILNRFPEAGMVYGATDRWFGWTGKPEDIQQDFCDHLGLRTAPAERIFPPGELIYHLLKGVVPCMCSLMIRSQTIRQFQGFETSFRGLYEDQVFFTKALLQTSIFVTNKCLAKYRQHPSSCCYSTENTAIYDQSRYMFLQWIRSYLAQNKFRDRDVANLLREDIRPYENPRLHHFYVFARTKKWQLKQVIKRHILRITPLDLPS
jgi:glycosyltransferase involved in cell wall biosynthesis